MLNIYIFIPTDDTSNKIIKDIIKFLFKDIHEINPKQSKINITTTERNIIKNIADDGNIVVKPAEKIQAYHL